MAKGSVGVSGYTRRTKSGKVVQVQQYTQKRDLADLLAAPGRAPTASSQGQFAAGRSLPLTPAVQQALHRKQQIELKALRERLGKGKKQIAAKQQQTERNLKPRRVDADVREAQRAGYSVDRGTDERLSSALERLEEAGIKVSPNRAGKFKPKPLRQPPHPGQFVTLQDGSTVEVLGWTENYDGAGTAQLKALAEDGETDRIDFPDADYAEYLSTAETPAEAFIPSEEFAGKWKSDNGSGFMYAARKDAEDALNGKSLEGESARDALRALRAIDSATPTEEPLYRGLMFGDAGEVEELIEAIRTDGFTEVLASFSESKFSAEDFATTGGSGVGKVSAPVVIETTGPVKGVDLWPDDDESEVLSGGKFEYVSDSTKNGMTTIKVRQTATPTPENPTGEVTDTVEAVADSAAARMFTHPATGSEVRVPIGGGILQHKLDPDLFLVTDSDGKPTRYLNAQGASATIPAAARKSMHSNYRPLSPEVLGESTRELTEGETEPLSDQEFEARVEQIDAAIQQAMDKGLATHFLHTEDGDGVSWTAERADFHNALIDDFFADVAARNVPKNRKAVMSGGLPGAGKTTVLRNHAGIETADYLELNADVIKEMIADRNAVPVIEGFTPMEMASLMHEESNYVVDLIQQRALSEGYNIVKDVTMGGSADYPMEALNTLKGSGYEVEAVFVDIPYEVSRRRAQYRHRAGVDMHRAGEGNGGRYVPPTVSRPSPSGEWNSQNRDIFESIKDNFSQWRVFDNSTEGGQPSQTAQSQNFTDEAAAAQKTPPGIKDRSLDGSQAWDEYERVRQALEEDTRLADEQRARAWDDLMALLELMRNVSPGEPGWPSYMDFARIGYAPGMDLWPGKPSS